MLISGTSEHGRFMQGTGGAAQPPTSSSPSLMILHYFYNARQGPGDENITLYEPMKIILQQVVMKSGRAYGKINELLCSK